MRRARYIGFLCGLLSTLFNAAGQEKISIYNPDFSSTYQGGWKVNGDSYFASNNLILTDDAQYKAGSAFWKRKLALQSNLSFSAYFEFKITKTTSRADGITFTIQQASNTAGTNGSGMGYFDLPGKSVAIEYDTYDNNSGTLGESDNHIAIDVNGNIHNRNRTDFTSSYPFQPSDPYVIQLDPNVLDLADGAVKYNWIDYDGVNNILEVRISNSPARPVEATMRITTLNLENTLAGGDVFFGFSAATGLFSEQQLINKFFLRNKFNPFGGNLNDGDFQQSTVDLLLTSSNNISCSQPSSVVTVVSSDQLNALSSVGLTFTLDQGQAEITPTTITTNEQTGTATFTVSNMTTPTVKIRATSTDGAFETIIITKTDIYLSGNFTSCVGGTTQLSTNDMTSGTWSSTNPAVASVSNTGVVSAKYLGGTTTISYTPIGGSTCAVSGTFEVQSISLSSTTNTLLYLPVTSNGSTLNVTTLANSGIPKSYKWYMNTINSKNGATLVATHNTSSTSDAFTTPVHPPGRYFYYCELETQKGCNTYSSYLTWIKLVNRQGLTAQGDKILYPTVNYVNADGEIKTTEGVDDQGKKFSIQTVPSLTSLAVSNITSTGFTAGASNVFDSGSSITEKGIVYSYLSSPTIDDSKEISSSTGSGTFTMSITNVFPSTRYFVRPYITNALGTYYGNQQIVNTTASTNTTAYRYYMWNIESIRTNPSAGGAVQVAEFNFITSGVTESWAGVSVTARGENAASSEDISKLIDGFTSTKWLDFSNSGTPITWVKFDFGAGNAKAFNGYKWYTANDEDSRDPVSWTLQGSNDGTNWTTLDSRTNYSVTNNRISQVGPFTY